jgi:hypothetical protein
VQRGIKIMSAQIEESDLDVSAMIPLLKRQFTTFNLLDQRFVVQGVVRLHLFRKIRHDDANRENP